jgi:hypothetical protein
VTVPDSSEKDHTHFSVPSSDTETHLQGGASCIHLWFTCQIGNHVYCDGSQAGVGTLAKEEQLFGAVSCNSDCDRQLRCGPRRRKLLQVPSCPVPGLDTGVHSSLPHPREPQARGGG